MDFYYSYGLYGIKNDWCFLLARFAYLKIIRRGFPLNYCLLTQNFIKRSGANSSSLTLLVLSLRLRGLNSGYVQFVPFGRGGKNSRGEIYISFTLVSEVHSIKFLNPRHTHICSLSLARQLSISD